ncbi:5-hydroxytryptamine receptor-like [Saccostrea echinata]|uniref:5-hydroxytryptamine receptor-like n=1 Tax=Saccostrea echinata TaxID=191078 RepID=UPI002A830AEA|nr:5-hydroxytryptamine receptor-like [Saccostrea echinata]
MNAKQQNSVSNGTSYMDNIISIDLGGKMIAGTLDNSSSQVIYSPMLGLRSSNGTLRPEIMTFDPDNESLTSYQYEPKYDLELMIFICALIGCVIVSIVIGNVFVISAIILEKSLQGVSNYLILSLAVTDLMVAVLVMPLSLIDEISLYWYLGPAVCDMWTSFDLLCCTASILHLVAISLDRYWAVSNIDYIRRRCAKQILCMVAVVWVVAIAISIAPLFGWKEEEDNPEHTGVCKISQDKAYTIFSTVGAFYCPLILMVVLNLKIYKAARSRIRKKHISGLHRPVRAYQRPSITAADATTRHNSSGSDISQDGYTVYNGVHQAEEPVFQEAEQDETAEVNTRFLVVPSNVYVLNKQLNPPKNTNNNNTKQVPYCDKERLRKAKIEMKRERKAARVLGIITGAFIVCWLPFFLLALISPFCPSCDFHPAMFSVFLWLGYLNSLLNPIIYTIFNPSFRNAFRKLIFKRYRRH